MHRRATLARQALLEVGSPVYLLRYSSDRRRLAAAGQDAIVRLFDPATGRVLQELATGQIEVNGVAFSPDGRELATAGDDGTFRIWDRETGAQRQRRSTSKQGLCGAVHRRWPADDHLRK